MDTQSQTCGGPYPDCEAALWRVLRVLVDRSGSIGLKEKGIYGVLEDEVSLDPIYFIHLNHNFE
jgi:hypothetical protein